MNYKKQKAEDLLKSNVKSLLGLVEALQDVNEDDPSNDGNDATFTDSEGNVITLNINSDGNKFVYQIVTSAGLKLTLESNDNDKFIKAK